MKIMRSLHITKNKFIFTILMLCWDTGQENLEKVYRVNFGEVKVTESPCKKQ